MESSLAEAAGHSRGAASGRAKSTRRSPPGSHVKPKRKHLINQFAEPLSTKRDGAFDHVHNDACGVDVQQDHHVKTPEQSARAAWQRCQA